MWLGLSLREQYVQTQYVKIDLQEVSLQLIGTIWYTVLTLKKLSLHSANDGGHDVKQLQNFTG